MRSDRSPAIRAPKRHPSLVSVVVLGGRAEPELLGMVASLACAAGHQLGAAILDSGDYGLKPRPVERLEIVSQQGMTGVVDGQNVMIGDEAFLASRGISARYLGDWADRLTEQGQDVTFVAVDEVIEGLLGIYSGTAELSPTPSSLNGEKR